MLRAFAMDPATTLITFLLQTDPSVRSVQLIGSWDNFTTWYTMNQDLRRGRGQWRGCHSFKNIISCDETSSVSTTRNGGLKMGDTYYYYYEVDGSTEIHDPSQPSTTACPYMPGQTVNTLHVPVEQTPRYRSASVNSLRQESFRTMNPEARYISPVPAPAAVANAATRRLGSASNLLHNRSSTRSESAGPSWKRFFSRKLTSLEMDRPSTSCRGRYDALTPSGLPLPDSRPTSSSDGRRTRDISPESLRRFLVEDPPLPPAPTSTLNNLPSTLTIPSELAEEAEDDDDNFATSATSEVAVFGTRLSPPPFQRSVSSGTLPQVTTRNSSSLTLNVLPIPVQQDDVGGIARQPSDVSQPPKPGVLKNERDWSPSISSTTFTTSLSPQSATEELPPFYDSNDDDDLLSSNDDGDYSSYRPRADLSTQGAFDGYCLPRHTEEDKPVDGSRPRKSSFKTTPFLTDRDSAMPISDTNFLGGPIDSGLDDFVNELGLIVNDIGNKCNQV